MAQAGAKAPVITMDGFVKKTANSGDALRSLLKIVERLREPDGGCPWDIEQTFASIAPHTVEEAYEVADAISRNAWSEVEGELGDLLLQVAYHAQIGSEQGLFDFESIAERVADKMISRHPHVFAGAKAVATASQQTRNWENEKARERGGNILDGVALGLPALMRAVKLQKRAANHGFDWPSPEPVVDKLIEEESEFAQARRSGDRGKATEEMGDMFFTLVNFARHLDIDPETALREANRKFERRFAAMEAGLKAMGRTVADASPEERDRIWNEVKASEVRG